MTNLDKMFNSTGGVPVYSVWNVQSISSLTSGDVSEAIVKKTERDIKRSSLHFVPMNITSLKDEHARPAKRLVTNEIIAKARRKRKLILFAQYLDIDVDVKYLVLNDARSSRRWIKLDDCVDPIISLEKALNALCEFEKRDIFLVPSGPLVEVFRQLVRINRKQHVVERAFGSVAVSLEIYSHGMSDILGFIDKKKPEILNNKMSHLDRLEAESIHIMREVMADANNPVMLYSVGKDSSVLLHLARKAFYPSKPPFPLLHIDTQWKFQAMYDFRDYAAQTANMELLVHVNPEGKIKKINPFDHGSTIHTDIMKTQSLKMALDHYKFDVAFGGARRDEEKSRSKERVFSFRTATHRWDPKNQRPELWNLYNGKKNKDETIRVFPLSNWTEIDIWQYIYRENIPIVPLYFASERPVVERNGMLLMVDDDRFVLNQNEQIKVKKIRFRTLGCYPLTGAIESNAHDVGSIILELLQLRTSERQGRSIDVDSSSSMEKKKQEGYF